MSAIYDNWERLVAAVLRREELRQLCYADSIDTSTRSESLSGDLSASSWISGASPQQQSLSSSKAVVLGKIEEYEEADHQYPRFRSLSFGYEAMPSTSAEFVSPAEILETLRKERFATPYRLEMDNGITTEVIRLRDVGASNRHLDENMRVSRHKNVAPHEVFFSYEDEMLLIYEHESQGGVSTFLQHGKKELGIYKLEWESRVRIAICVARAIANSHSQYDNKLIRGETASSDAFLKSQTNDCFSDLGLEDMAEVSMVISTAGYRAPEVNYDHPPSQAYDVYSFGVLLLELLTGAFPIDDNFDDKMRLVRRVTDKFLEAGTLIVFDFVPVRNPTALIEMWRMLLVAMRCLEENPGKRPKSSDVVKMMEGIKSVPPEINGN